jgi:hypothetical protein
LRSQRDEGNVKKTVKPVPQASKLTRPLQLCWPADSFNPSIKHGAFKRAMIMPSSMKMRSNSPLSQIALEQALATEARIESSVLEAEQEGARLSAEALDVPQINDAEANNLSFILSDRFARNPTWRMMLDFEHSDVAISELSDRVARRLEKLSLRLGNDVANSKFERP